MSDARVVDLPSKSILDTIKACNKRKQEADTRRADVQARQSAADSRAHQASYSPPSPPSPSSRHVKIDGVLDLLGLSDEDKPEITHRSSSKKERDRQSRLERERRRETGKTYDF